MAVVVILQNVGMAWIFRHFVRRHFVRGQGVGQVFVGWLFMDRRFVGGLFMGCLIKGGRLARMRCLIGKFAPGIILPALAMLLTGMIISDVFGRMPVIVIARFRCRV